jgi:A/G-specific adenine glycosylase
VVSSEEKKDIPRESVTAFRKAISVWFRDNGKSYPWRKAGSSYGILMAEIFLQRTQAKQVVPVYEQFIARFPSLVDLAAADTMEIERIISPLGLKKRAGQLKDTAVDIIQKYSGQIPSDPAELVKLRGIGQDTANAVSVFAFGQHQPLVDANVIRILGRVFGIRSSLRRPRTDSYLWNVLRGVVPEECACEFNWALIDFGSSVCIARRPHCGSCALSSLCLSADTGSSGRAKRQKTAVGGFETVSSPVVNSVYKMGC